MPEKQGVELNLFRNPGREVALDGDKDPKAPCRLWRKMLQPENFYGKENSRTPEDKP